MLQNKIFEVIAADDLPSVKQLIEQYPNLVHIKNERGMTPLHKAAAESEDNADMVHYLLANGANPQERDSDGWTALDWADFMVNRDVLLLLNEALQNELKMP